MEEFEPKRRTKLFNKEFIAKYSYVLVLAVLLIGGISYGYTFFTENKKIASGSITTANLTINFSNLNINATNLSVPTNDQEGLSEFSKSVTITNTTNVDGKVTLSLERSSGLQLTDMRYATSVNGAIQEIDDVPSDGEILSSAIMGNDSMDVEVMLWPKSTYSGSTRTFSGELSPEISYLGNTATDTTNLTGKYVNFNGNEVWRIVKIEDDRLVLTRQADYTNATSRTNSNKYNSSLTFNDNSLITSVSTDNKNVYLAKTTNITSGSGTQEDPYTLVNNEFREEDKKVIAIITYKDNNNTTVGTQNIYYNETNYISQVINSSDFVGWSTTNGGTVEYELGSVYNITNDQNLYAVLRYRISSMIANNADTETEVNFRERTEQGLYLLTGTANNTHPIYFYRGSVNNNNVIFGGYCWLIVRTTDTGGTKMIYNGEPEVSGSGNNTTYDCSSTRPFLANDTSKKVRISLSNGSGYYFADDYEIESVSGNKVTYRLKSNENPITQVAVSYSNGNTTIPTIIENYPYTCLSTSTDYKCSEIYKVDTQINTMEVYAYSSSEITSIGKSEFNVQGKSASDVGYMYNTQYNYKVLAPTSGAYFGTEVEYGDFDSNGTNEYRLVSGTTGTTLDEYHHYSCDLTSDTGTCTTIRYYYYYSGSYYRYIELTNGETVEDALYKMTGNGIDAVKQRNNGYNLNINDSTIKTMIDNWFRENLTNEVDQTNTNYASYLEDTTFCNDRSYCTYVNGNVNYSMSGSGWNPNGGSLNKSLYFGAENRYSPSGGWKITPALPSLTCPNETDQFRVGNNKAKLDYPVGLLTSDEELLVGSHGYGTDNMSFTANGTTNCTLSPESVSYTSARQFFVSDSAYVNSNDGTKKYAVRPVISLKADVEYENGGNGTPTNPYVIKYN